jgi:hypothetical protein
VCTNPPPSGFRSRWKRENGWISKHAAFAHTDISQKTHQQKLPFAQSSRCFGTHAAYGCVGDDVKDAPLLLSVGACLRYIWPLRSALRASNPVRDVHLRHLALLAPGSLSVTGLSATHCVCCRMHTSRATPLFELHARTQWRRSTRSGQRKEG